MVVSQSRRESLPAMPAHWEDTAQLYPKRWDMNGHSHQGPQHHSVSDVNQLEVKSKEDVKHLLLLRLHNKEMSEQEKKREAAANRKKSLKRFIYLASFLG